MPRILKFIIPLFFLLFLIKPALADNQVNLYFFYGDGCPHCAREELFLEKLEKENKNVEIHRYEVWYNRENAKLLAKVAKVLDIKASGVPVSIIGDKVISGYYNDQTTGAQIKQAIEYYTVNDYVDRVAPIVNYGQVEDREATELKIPETINIPLFGQVRTKNMSLPVFTILIAGLDGFNPCAMWVLLFLISLLLGIKNRKRMWILGSAFIFASGLVYFLFLSAWLNFFLFIGFILWVRIFIGLFALIGGGYHIRQYWRNRKGTCEVIEEDRRKRIFGRLREIVKMDNFWIALGGIILLAGAVNLVELLCSAGLPAVYTQVLALSSLPRWQYYGYLLLYIFIFMLDDLLIFIIAMSTLKMKALSSKYTRWSSLIGGIVMLVIGLLLIFKPGWLMF